MSTIVLGSNYIEMRGNIYLLQTKILKLNMKEGEDIQKLELKSAPKYPEKEEKRLAKKYYETNN